MNNLESYLRERYEATKWPYYNLITAKFKVGESFDSDVKELRQKQMIEPCAGINGWQIKILDFETKWNFNNQNNQP